MKLNWGTGITIVIILFLGWIFFLVFKTSGERIDLVTEDYYPKELKYQETIEKSANYKALSNKITITQNNDTICIKFPDNFLTDSLTGNIHLYRPSDKFLDKEFHLNLFNESTYCISSKELVAGKYELILDWKHLNKTYFFKESVFIR